MSYAQLAATDKPRNTVGAGTVTGSSGSDFEPIFFDTPHMDARAIPVGLDDIEPGAVLAFILDGINIGELCGYDRVIVLRAHQRLVSHYQAQLYTDMAGITTVFENPTDTPNHVADHVSGEPSGGPSFDAVRDAGVEIGCALHLTRRAADTELGVALELTGRLPRLHEMLTLGLVDVRRVKCMSAATIHLDTDTARGVIDSVANEAPGLTTGQLRARIAKLCINVNPDDAARRFQTAHGDRRVVMEATTEGTANLMGLALEPGRVVEITNRINNLAKSLRRGGETRTMDQLRADVYVDLLTGTNYHAAGRGVIHITTDLQTLTRLNDHPGDLGGYGPVIADITRQIVAQNADTKTEWRWSITDPDTGELTHTGTTTRRPGAAIRRAVEMRHTTCVFPGCRMPSVESDLDHRDPVTHGGPTTPPNLAPLCRFHHTQKHLDWRLEKLDNGDYQWTSPLGHTYTTRRAPP
ncbi:MAG: DUF222 domain-containing protein [Acidobacteria bacterium]|nr:DUF222 domain-containing protein [Acidobacteriota bacterium]